MTSIAEETGTAQAEATGAQPKGTKKARVGKRGAHVAFANGKSGEKATPAKKAPHGAKKASGARDGSKAAAIVDLPMCKDGATLKELMKVSGWQAHSVRGFLSGTVGKKMGLAITSTKADRGERSYSVKS